MVLEFKNCCRPGLEFRVDYLGLFMVLLFCLYGVILFVYTLGFMSGRPQRIRFWGVTALTFAGCLGVVMAGDLLSLFLFFEFMSVMFFVMLTQQQTPEAIAASTKFLFMTIIAGVGLFLGMVVTYLQTGTLAFGQGGVFPGGTVPAVITFIGFLTAFGIKASMFPLHLWMPDAYTAAPVPAAALSSGMLLKTGVYGLIRVFYDLYGIELVREAHFHTVLLILACITILRLIMSQQGVNLNRRLASPGLPRSAISCWAYLC